MKKKLFFLSRGANWQLYRLEVLTKLAEEYNYKVEMLTIGELKPYLEDNDLVKYKKFFSFLPLSFNINFFPGALWYIIKNKPDYVLALPGFGNLTEFLAVPVCKIFNISIVFWTHGYDHGKRKNSLINNIRVIIIEYFLKQVDHVFVFSEKGKDYLVSKNVLEKNITVTPNTLNTDLWLNRSKECKKTQVRKHYGYDDKTMVLLFSGRLNKDKKVNNILYAIERIQNEHKNFNIYLNIVGDGSERENLEEYVRKNKLKNVVFHGFIFDKEKITEMFCISDLFIMPGYVGLAIVHAFCFGLPIITENIDYHSPEIQYLEDDINGYFTEEDNIGVLVEKLIYLFSNKHKLQEMSNAALITAKGKASIHNMIKMMNSGFEKISS